MAPRVGWFSNKTWVYNFTILGLICAINCNPRNGDIACFLAVSMIECNTAYVSASENVRKSPATFILVLAGLTARSLELLPYGTSRVIRKSEDIVLFVGQPVFHSRELLVICTKRTVKQFIQPLPQPISIDYIPRLLSMLLHWYDTACSSQRYTTKACTLGP